MSQPNFFGNNTAPMQPTQPPVSDPWAAAATQSANPFKGGRRDYEEQNPESADEQNARFAIERAIYTGEIIPNFDMLFTRYVLNQPPHASLVVVGKFDGIKGVKNDKGAAKAGEIAYIPVEAIYSLLDATFQSWNTKVLFQQVEPIKADGTLKHMIICTVELEVIYPFGTIRRVTGAFETNFTQQTAASAAIAMATKSAAKRLGRYFGRDLFSDKISITELDEPKEKKGFTNGMRGAIR